MICILETHFDSSISAEDNRIQRDEYNMIRADHPINKIENLLEGVFKY